jgi:hypothetical protein
MKIIGIICGIQSYSSKFACPYCEGCKDPITKQWEKGELRTPSNIDRYATKYQQEGDGNRKKLSEFKSVEFNMIKVKENQDNIEVLITHPPDILHFGYLGAASDGVEKLIYIYPIEMDTFFKKHHLNKSGEGTGGKFNGPS